MAENTIIVVSDSEDSTSQGNNIPVKHETSVKKNRLHKIGRRVRDPFNKRKVKEVKQEKNALEAVSSGHVMLILKAMLFKRIHEQVCLLDI